MSNRGHNAIVGLSGFQKVRLPADQRASAPAPLDFDDGLSQRWADKAIEVGARVGWTNLVELGEVGEGEIGVVQQERFSIWHDDGSSSWAKQTPGTFMLAFPRYDASTDALVGSSYEALPAAQQYGMKAAGWIAANKDAWIATRRDPSGSELCSALDDLVGGEEIFIDQTGGGCATIFIGPTYTDDDGDLRWTVAIGPGAYAWDGPGASSFTFDELCVGRDGGDEAVYVTNARELRAEVRRLLGGPF